MVMAMVILFHPPLFLLVGTQNAQETRRNDDRYHEDDEDMIISIMMTPLLYSISRSVGVPVEHNTTTGRVIMVVIGYHFFRLYTVHHLFIFVGCISRCFLLYLSCRLQVVEVVEA